MKSLVFKLICLIYPIILRVDTLKLIHANGIDTLIILYKLLRLIETF